eukprot:775656-Lingulodinium_polyedra.AAC.1
MDLQLLSTACGALGSLGAAVTTTGAAAQVGGPDVVLPRQPHLGRLASGRPRLAGQACLGGPGACACLPPLGCNSR